MKCVICQKPVGARAENPAFPFCSSRCRFVDLGKWLGEEYRLPEGLAEEQEDEIPTPSDGGPGDPER